MNIQGNLKGNLNSYLDLKALGLRKDLHPIQNGSKLSLSGTLYALSNEEKRTLCEFLKAIKVLGGYSLNIGTCVNPKERTILGSKSHDCQVVFHCFLLIRSQEL